MNTNNKELIELLYRHDDIVDMRKEKGVTVNLDLMREKERVTFEIMNLLSKSMQEQKKVQKEIEIRLNTISKKLEKVVQYFRQQRQREKKVKEMLNVQHMMSKKQDIMKKRFVQKKEYLA